MGQEDVLNVLEAVPGTLQRRDELVSHPLNVTEVGGEPVEAGLVVDRLTELDNALLQRHRLHVQFVVLDCGVVERVITEQVVDAVDGEPERLAEVERRRADFLHGVAVVVCLFVQRT